MTPSPPTGHSACSRKAGSSSSVACRTRATQPFRRHRARRAPGPGHLQATARRVTPVGLPRRPLQREIAAPIASEALVGISSRPPSNANSSTVSAHSNSSCRACSRSTTTLHEESDRYDDEFRRICAFDIVINNTDRKAGHCVLGVDDKIWAIDHGVAFHQEFKLRTVLWDFVGEDIPDSVRRPLAPRRPSSGTVRGPAESVRAGRRDDPDNRTRHRPAFPRDDTGDVAIPGHWSDLPPTVQAWDR